jgi:predicted transcriptional regulator
MCGKHYEKWRAANPKAVTSYGDMRQQVLDALPATRPELQEKLGINRSTAQSWLKKLRDERAIHISKWQRPKVSGNFLAVHAVGFGIDARFYLKPKTSAVYANRYREQKRQHERTRYYEAKAKKKPQTWFSALGAA